MYLKRIKTFYIEQAFHSILLIISIGVLYIKEFTTLLTIEKAGAPFIYSACVCGIIYPIIPMLISLLSKDEGRYYEPITVPIEGIIVDKYKNLWVISINNFAIPLAGKEVEWFKKKLYNKTPIQGHIIYNKNKKKLRTKYFITK